MYSRLIGYILAVIAIYLLIHYLLSRQYESFIDENRSCPIDDEGRFVDSRPPECSEWATKCRGETGVPHPLGAKWSAKGFWKFKCSAPLIQELYTIPFDRIDFDAEKLMKRVGAPKGCAACPSKRPAKGVGKSRRKNPTIFLDEGTNILLYNNTAETSLRFWHHNDDASAPSRALDDPNETFSSDIKLIVDNNPATAKSISVLPPGEYIYGHNSGGGFTGDGKILVYKSTWKPDVIVEIKKDAANYKIAVTGDMAADDSGVSIVGDTDPEDYWTIIATELTTEQPSPSEVTINIPAGKIVQFNTFRSQKPGSPLSSENAVITILKDGEVVAAPWQPSSEEFDCSESIALFKADFFPGDFTIKYEPDEEKNFTWSKIKINILPQDPVTNFEECKEACPNSMPECLDACESQYNTVAEEEASSHKCAADPRFDASRDPAHEHRSSVKEFGIAGEACGQCEKVENEGDCGKAYEVCGKIDGERHKRPCKWWDRSYHDKIKECVRVPHRTESLAAAFERCSEEASSQHKCAADPRFDASRDPAHEHRSSVKEFGIAGEACGQCEKVENEGDCGKAYEVCGKIDGEPHKRPCKWWDRSYHDTIRECVQARPPDVDPIDRFDFCANK